jgi:starch-binding outer membrane protein, SusD/RagB family
MMKTLRFILFLVLLSGCEDFSDHQDYTFTGINNVAEMEQCLTSIFSSLLDCMMVDGQIIPQQFADDFALIPYKDSYYNIHEYSYGENQVRESAIWTKLYNVVGFSNQIICHLDKKTNLDTAMSKRLGEAYYLRAYAYFRLVRIFKNIPLVKDLEIKYTLPAASNIDLYSFIESDLKKAIQLLPANRSAARYFTTPHRGSAKALLAEVYLTMGGFPVKDISKYSLAAKLAGEVIDSSVFFGFELLPDFKYLWNGYQYYNKETIFGLYSETGSVLANTRIYTDTTFLELYHLSPYILANTRFYNNYPTGYRRDETFQSILPVFRNSKYVIYPVVFKDFKQAESTTPIFYKKFEFYCSFDTTTAYNTSDYFNLFWGRLHYYFGQPIYVFRYAHTLLTYAEAKARSGQLDASAYEAVNRIRRRANKAELYSPSKYDLVTGLTSEQFCDSVIKERELELCGETEGRWFDLLRLDMVDQIPTMRGGGPATSCFARAPEFDRNLNPNLNDK